MYILTSCSLRNKKETLPPGRERDHSGPREGDERTGCRKVGRAVASSWAVFILQPGVERSEEERLKRTAVGLAVYSSLTQWRLSLENQKDAGGQTVVAATVTRASLRVLSVPAVGISGASVTRVRTSHTSFPPVYPRVGSSFRFPFTTPFLGQTPVSLGRTRSDPKAWT